MLPKIFAYLFHLLKDQLSESIDVHGVLDGLE